MIMKILFLIISLFVIDISFGQYAFQIDDTTTISMDTISVEGFLVTYVSKNDIKTKKHRKNKIIQMIDVISGASFFTQNEFSYIQPMNEKKITEVENKQNAVYLFASNKVHSFFKINLDYFDGKLTSISIDNKYYPSFDNYSYKDKKWIYKSSKVKVTFLMFYVKKEDLSRLVNGTKNYILNQSKIPIFIAQKIIDE